MLTNIVDINEGTDCLALFLDTVGDIYKGYMDATITRLTSLLEAIPVMVLPFIP
jgi:type II secretory pathway component PulF